MTRVCNEYGASSVAADTSCRTSGQSLTDSVEAAASATFSSLGPNTGPMVATMLIGVLLLCCLGLSGIALLNELMPAHPLRTLLVGTPTPTATRPATPTTVARATPSPTRHSIFPPELKDEFEPDDTRAQATEIDTDGTRQTHTLSPPGDLDHVSFQVTEGMQYTMETGNLGDDCDTVLTLYDENGTQLGEDDDGGNESLASRLIWVADEDGILFVTVAQFDGEEEEGDTEYDVWVIEGEPVTFQEDEYEPDDTIAQASEILVDTPQTHTIHVAGDEDWVFFQADEGTTYLIETSDLLDETDTIIYLHDEDGEGLAQNDDGGEEGLASRIIWRADYSGIHYVMVRYYREDVVGPDMGYTITVSEGAPFEADGYEPDDAREQASEIQVGSHQNHNLHVTGDRDWISFRAEAGTRYVVETYSLGGGIDTIIFLYDSRGRELANDDDSGGEPLASRIAWTPEEDLVVYVMVLDFGDDEAGPGTEYAISVHEQDEGLLVPDQYEPDDSMDEASGIELGEYQRHSIHLPGDHDWLSFRAMQGTTYLVETSNLGPEMDTVVFLYAQDGEELAQDDDGAEEPRASRITWTATKTGTLHILVRDYKDSRAEPMMQYDVSVREAEAAGGGAIVYVAEGAEHFVAH